MANLGTLDMAGRNNPQNTFNNYFAKQIATNGTDLDKMLFMLGNYAGNYFGRQRSKKDNSKLDSIIDSAQQAPVTVSGDIGMSVMTPEQIAAMQPQTQNTDNAVISGGNNNLPAKDPVIDSIVNMPTNNATITQAATNGGMNNYNMDYIKKQAREQGISDAVLSARQADIQKSIAQKANDIYMPQIMRGLYGYSETGEDGKQVFRAPTNDTRIQAIQQLQELKKYDPATANAYLANTIKGIEGENAANRNFENQKTLARIAHDYRTEEANNRASNARGNALYRANLGGGGGGRRGGSRGVDISKLEKDYEDVLGKIDEMEKGALESGQSNFSASQNELYTTRKKKAARLKAAIDEYRNGVSEDDNVERPQNNNTDSDSGYYEPGAKDIMESIDFASPVSIRNVGEALAGLAETKGGDPEKAKQMYADFLYKKVKAGELDRDTYLNVVGNNRAKEDINDEAVDRTLHPDKYGEDSLAGLKNFFKGEFDDSYGQSLKKK